MAQRATAHPAESPPRDAAHTAYPADRATESFQGLLLRHRGRTRLTQRQLAALVGVSRRSVQDWESGLNYPDAHHLQALIGTFLEAGGLTARREASEAEELWAAALRQAPRLQTAFDAVWWANLLIARTAVADTSPARPSALAKRNDEASRGDEKASHGDEKASRADEKPTLKRSMASRERHRDVTKTVEPQIVIHERRQDWGEAPDVVRFVGRSDEVATLRDWVLEERCRLVTVLGLGGIGKTILAARLAQDVAPNFQLVFWRSLRDALPTSEWLAGAIGFLSDPQLVPPRGEAAHLAVLLQLLRDRPCLLVLDNFETLLEPGDREGRYRDGYAGYGRVLQAIGEGRHQSCLVVTSREAPPELVMLPSAAVRALHLGGLGVPEGQVLLADKQLSGSPADWATLIGKLGGNGLALRVVGESVRQVFGGDIGAFLEESGSAAVYGGIRRLLAEQLERSSALEQDVLRVLAVEREPVTLAELIADLGPRVRRGAVMEALEALRRRSLVERAETAGAPAFTLQSVVLEYATDRLVEEVCHEIARGRPLQLLAQPLIKAQAKEYVRQSQERLIGRPILRRIAAERGVPRTERLLLALLEHWRDRPAEEQGYGPGNVVNLLRLQRGDLRGLDLGHLAVRQAYLADVDAHDASLAGAHLSEAVLAEAFNFPVCVALSSDGAFLATGTSAGEVWLWRVADRTPQLAVQGHSSPVHGVALSVDGRLLVSGSEDGTVRCWSLAGMRAGEGAMLGINASGVPPSAGLVQLLPSGQVLATLRGHSSGVWGVALSADGRLLASGSLDGTVRLWETHSASPAARFGSPGAHFALHAHSGELSPDSADSGDSAAATSIGDQPLATLEGHTSGVRSVALSADGRLVASGSLDGTVRLWETANGGRLLGTLPGHTGGVRGVALSADGRLLASASWDGTVRLWATAGGGRPLATLDAHTGGVWGVALSADGRLLASGGLDSMVRLWEVDLDLPDGGEQFAGKTADPGDAAATPPSGARLVATLPGHTGGVRGVALSADGRLLASGGFDGIIRLCETPSGRLVAKLQGVTGGVRGVTLSAGGGLLASGSWDGTIRLCDASSGRLLDTLQGHTGVVWSVALSADERLLASGSLNGTIRLWEVPFARVTGDEQFARRRADFEDSAAAPPSGGRLLGALKGHTGTIYGVALSADGRLLASGSEDGTVRLWETNFGSASAPSGSLVATLQGHTGGVMGVALRADGRLLASGALDGTVRLWEPSSGRELAILQDQTHAGAGSPALVYGVALSADGRLLATGSSDGNIRLWDVPSRQLLATLHGHTGLVHDVTLSADGRLLASGGWDGIIQLWDTPTKQLLTTLRGHTGGVRGVALSADGRLLASGGLDGTVRLWETQFASQAARLGNPSQHSGAALRVLRSDRRYERVDITGLTGVTAAQHAALLALGAVDRQNAAATTVCSVPA